MRVLLYCKNQETYQKSGIGRAMKHQALALEKAGVDYTTNENEDYDIVHINTVDPYSMKMAKKARKAGKKVVYHAHSTQEDFENSFMFSNMIAPAFKKLLLKAYNYGDYLLTPTPYSKTILESYGIDKPIEAISNGIDLNRFKRDEEKVTKFREYFNLDETDKVIISVGLYFERKGLPDFMEVARRLPEYTFIWFGHTPLASVTKNIRRAIRNKPDNVILPGYIAGDIIEGAYADADIFFFPSYEETEGIVVLEALAANCQVVIRDIGVYDGWMESGVNCYKGNNNFDFTLLLRGLIEGETKSTVKQGYKVAKARSIDKIGEQLKDIYERVLEL